MLKSNVALTVCALITSACATPVPVAVSCPVPPPLPVVLSEPASTAPSLSQQYEFSIQKFRDSLSKAAKPL